MVQLLFFQVLVPDCVEEKYLMTFIRNAAWGFPGGTVVKNLPANAGYMGSSPGLGIAHMPWSN